jgi:glycosyltransferase involved in cell wall biosynthesis
MSKPLVTHVLWTLGRGGAERMVFDLARALPAAGFDVQVLAAGGGGEMQAEFEAAGIPVHARPSGEQSRFASVRFLRDQIRARRPNIFHSHLTPVWAGIAARTTFVRPWVTTAHGFEPDVSFFSRLARRWAYGAADRVICVSEAVRIAMHKRYGVSPSKTLVIPPGVDPIRFPVRESRMLGDIPILVTVGRLAPEKGLETLFHALSELLRPWRLIVVGSGPEEVHLKRLAETLGILPRIRFVGAVSDPSPYLRQADVFCFPSLHEGQGMALIEAAMSRVPAVSSDLPAVREAFGDEGVVYAKPGDIQDWKRALELMFSRSHESVRRAETAYESLHKRYTLDAMVKKHAELYRSLLRV